MKEVINICDGRRMGRPIDLVLNDNACATALVTPGPTSWKQLVRGVKEGYEIPWNRIRRVGDDVILVELDPSFFEC
jgi:YlmC/YmxH family sporulation protein